MLFLVKSVLPLWGFSYVAQRITEEDLQTMDRDDVEHLFKNDYGFTFADRKRLWAAVQTLVRG